MKTDIRFFKKSLLVSSCAIGIAAPLPTLAQQPSGAMVLEEVVVTARRREERLQDVPISMTVFSQQELDRANITNAGDLATYTPSLSVNTRYGGDTTSFAIRGFSQELRTTASVGVYFAEVVAPRGANTVVSGDGAGPGDLFDLENIQVLKGPQGTLFGRNTTGGAVLLTPKKPTDEFEGYAEASAGNYDMWRGQGVLNLPVSDTVRLRLGVDHQERDGHLNNISGIGPDDFANVDYTALRGSLVVDLMDNLENYTIVKTVESENNGSPSSIFYCNPAVGGMGLLCAGDMARRAAAGNDDFYDVYSFMPKPISEQQQWQLLNTTTWEINDDLTVKNILSYAELETTMRSAQYGTNWLIPTGGGLVPLTFAAVGTQGSLPTTDQKTFVEELQIQGTALDSALTWQAGLYYEKSEPNGLSSVQAPAFNACDLTTTGSANPADFRCNNLFGIGVVQSMPNEATYENKAIYAQASYDFTEQLSGTLGLRYTSDDTSGWAEETVYYFPTNYVTGAYAAPTGHATEVRTPSVSSDEPTWLLGLDYKPMQDILLYAKYARGYRQGSVNTGGSIGLETHEPEQVDTYEIGAKTTFDGVMPGTFNISYFYNDFKDQQIQFGYFKPTSIGTTAILNAGSSTIWGFEAEAVVMPTDHLRLMASYSYLDTNVDEIVYPTLTNSPFRLNTTTGVDQPLPYTPKNSLVFTTAYLLPVAEGVGDVTLSATYVYTDERQAVSRQNSIYAVLPSYELVNLNADWISVYGSAVDLSLFATNVTDEEYITFMTGNWGNGFETGQVGTPRMFGVRAKYNF